MANTETEKLLMNMTQYEKLMNMTQYWDIGPLQ
jgi:hypothetical protein